MCISDLSSDLCSSDLLAVTIMGIWLGNRQGVPVEDILAFKETLRLLLLSGLFIILAARMDIADQQGKVRNRNAVVADMRRDDIGGKSHEHFIGFGSSEDSRVGKDGGSMYSTRW